MRIDNSRAKMWHKCPMAHQERYKKNREKDWEKITGKPPAHRYGSRMHELLEEHYKGEKGIYLRELPGIEDEAQLMFEMYKAHYPVEPFEVLEVERVFEVPLPVPCGECRKLTHIDKDGWFTMRRSKVLEYTGLDKDSQKRAKKMLNGLELIEIRSRPGNIHELRVNEDKMIYYVSEFLTKEDEKEHAKNKGGHDAPPVKKDERGANSAEGGANSAEGGANSYNLHQPKPIVS